jgi:hypothetical protein
VEGMLSLKGTLSKLKNKYGDNPKPSVSVGFTQAYGIFVHENLEAHHPTGQAKFLEQPAREMATEIPQIVKKTINDGGTLEDGLLVAGFELQRRAQQLTPVDTGALKASAFTSKTADEETAASTAHVKAQVIYNAAKQTAKQSKP